MTKEEMSRYTVTYKNTEKGQEYTKQDLSELEAVRLWSSCKLYANLEPVSVSPEPDWQKYNRTK